MVTGEQQGVLGPGERDVQQSAFLVDAAPGQLGAVGIDDGLQCLAVGDLGGVEYRHTV